MHKLYYSEPAKKWTETMPLGNGFTGVMVFGGHNEKIGVNDSTLWSGYPKRADSRESYDNLDAIRKLIFDKDYVKAEQECMKHMGGWFSEAYLPLGEIKLAIDKKDRYYLRQLDLDTAVCSINSNDTVRECFASYVDKVVCYKVKSNKNFSCKLSLSSPLRSEIRVDNGISVLGTAPDYVAPNYERTEKYPIRYDEGKGMSFALRVDIKTDGEIFRLKNRIRVIDAKFLELYITTATGFLGYDKMPNTDKEYAFDICKKRLSALAYPFEELKARHIKDYESVNAKQSFMLNTAKDMDTRTLLKRAKKGIIDNELVNLMYRYGKYLMIAGSREGGQPLNLQGIFNKNMRPAWSSNYTVNINTQMNYWLTTNCNLRECMEPYVRFVKELTESGKDTARINYGCEGSCCNHNSDIWRKTSPVKGSPSFMYAPLCGAWLANEIYEHYLNGGLEEYKVDVMEIVKQAALFANGYLVEHDGYYVTCPSTSPEAQFSIGSRRLSLGEAGAFEMAIIRQAFINFLATSDDENKKVEIGDKLGKLYPFMNGKRGIMEWKDDLDICEKGHRHFSPLYALYPARVIRYYSDGEQTEWSRKLYYERIANSKNHIGWSAGWGVCLAGRLHEGSIAYDIIKSFFKNSVFQNLMGAHFPNIFQIDGNFGFVAGINELAVYWENDIIELLPAMPKEWSSGVMTGYSVRGANIDFEWVNGKVIKISSDREVKILNKNIGKDCRINDNITIVNL